MLFKNWIKIQRLWWYFKCVEIDKLLWWYLNLLKYRDCGGILNMLKYIDYCGGILKLLKYRDCGSIVKTVVKI